MLIIVALASALTTMRLAVHGREVTVPDFAGMTPAEARAAAQYLGLEVHVEREYFSPSVAEGRVLSQMPQARTSVRQGWDVRLALSLGPQRVTIPQVVGETERAATINLAQRGLQLGTIAVVPAPGKRPGEVIAQDPPANATGVSAPKLNLLVAQNAAPLAFVMPSFIGQPLGTVSNALKDAGFSLGKITVAPSGTPPLTSAVVSPAQPQAPVQAIMPASPTALNPSAASIVVAQDPPAGSKVTAGAAIDFGVK